MKRVLFFILSAVLAVAAHGQNDDKFFDRSGFDDFRKSMYNDYQGFRTKIMKDYVEFVRKAWSEFKSESPVPVPEEKPLPPVVMPEGGVLPAGTHPVKIDEVIAPLPVNPQPFPVVKIEEQHVEEPSYVSFTFFGTEAKVRFSAAERVKLKGTNENSVADAIEAMAGKGHDNMILDCLALRESLQLSDWAYLQMVNELAKKIYPGDANGAELLTAYLFMQSGYKVRIGACNGRLYMLFACENFIFERETYWVGDCRYYGLGSLPSQMYICEAAFEKEQEISLAVRGNQRFAYSGSEPRRIASAEYPGVSVEVSVNRNLLDFYSTYPTSMVGDNMLTRWALYANTPLDDEICRALYPKLLELIDGLPVLDAVNRLLNLVQTGLVYEYDQTVWGYDRVFFSEESLFYPYCDCEDRSILFSRLVRDLLGLDVALVTVPGHMLTAVRLDADGAYTTIAGQKFVLCEPTCLNGAPVGWADIEDGAAMQVILLEKNEAVKSYRAKKSSEQA